MWGCRLLLLCYADIIIWCVPMPNPIERHVFDGGNYAKQENKSDGGFRLHFFVLIPEIACQRLQKHRASAQAKVINSKPGGAMIQ